LPEHVQISIGDVLTTPADVLISTANPWLNMSGGVNAAIRERDPSIQDELRACLQKLDKSAVPAGTVVATSAGNLPFSHILHAVAIDPFYDSSVEIVAATMESAFTQARALSAHSVSMPTLATGYGHLSVEDFGRALVRVMAAPPIIQRLTVVVRSTENADILRRLIDQAQPRPAE